MSACAAPVDRRQEAGVARVDPQHAEAAQWLHLLATRAEHGLRFRVNEAVRVFVHPIAAAPRGLQKENDRPLHGGMQTVRVVLRSPVARASVLRG